VGTFAAFIERPQTKSATASGWAKPLTSDQRLCPWNPDPRYRLAMGRRAPQIFEARTATESNIRGLSSCKFFLTFSYVFFRGWHRFWLWNCYNRK